MRQGKQYVGIDLGTGGPSVVVVENSQIVAKASRELSMVQGLPEGWQEQVLEAYISTVRECIADLDGQIEQNPNQVVIGLTGQMHGACFLDAEGKPSHPNCIIWADGRGQAEAAELTQLLQFPMRARYTATRLLMAQRHHPERLVGCTKVTTPAGYLAMLITGVFGVGVGEFSGMFPLANVTVQPDPEKLQLFLDLLGSGFTPELFPCPFLAGEFLGSVSLEGSQLFGLPVGAPVAAPEGDQQTALAGSFVYSQGDVAFSAGTSCVANVISPYHVFDSKIDCMFAPDGQRFNMVWRKNGTTFLNYVVALAQQVLDHLEVGDKADGFGLVIPMAQAAYQNLLASQDTASVPLTLPYLKTEIPAGYADNPLALISALSESNFGLGELALSAWLSVLFGIRQGLEQLKKESIEPKRVFLSGGIVKSEQFAAQTAADVLGLPVIIRDSATEGSAYGAAVLAEFADGVFTGQIANYDEFMLAKSSQFAGRTYLPNEDQRAAVDALFARFVVLNEQAKALSQI